MGYGATFLMALIFAIIATCALESGKGREVAKGRQAYVTGNYEEAETIFNALAKSESASERIAASYYLGIMHTCGYGVKQDHDKAQDWYPRAAKWNRRNQSTDSRGRRPYGDFPERARQVWNQIYGINGFLWEDDGAERLRAFCNSSDALIGPELKNGINY